MSFLTEYLPPTLDHTSCMYVVAAWEMAVLSVCDSESRMPLAGDPPEGKYLIVGAAKNAINCLHILQGLIQTLFFRYIQLYSVASFDDVKFLGTIYILIRRRN